MDAEGQNPQETSNFSDSSQRTQVGFPQTSQPKKFPTKILVILIILLGLGFGAWYIFKGRAKTEESKELSPTPTVRLTPTPTKAPIERDNVKIQVLNGTGLSGAAGSLKSELEELGYTKIDVGNAKNSNSTATKVIFNTTVQDAVKEEITGKLEDLYQEVEVETGSLSKYDVQITTGYPKGHTPTPTTSKVSSTPTPTSRVTGTPTVTPTRTLTVTPTSTITPTPTP